jgi:NTE family protein
MAKRALVLAGGGARGSYQVGMLHELIIEQGLDFQILRGVSVGALNTSFLAQAATGSNSIANLQDKLRQLESIWTEKIEGNHSVYYERGGFASLALGADSLYSFQPLINLFPVHHIPDSFHEFSPGVLVIQVISVLKNINYH